MEVPCCTVSLVGRYLEAVVAREVLHGLRYVVQHLSVKRDLNALEVRGDLEINNQFSVVFNLQVVEVLGDRYVVDVVDCADRRRRVF
jgi:hypothetical protein